MPAQRAERVAAVVQRLEHVGLQRQRALEALQRLVVAAQRVQRVAEVAVRAGVLRIDGQRLRDRGRRPPADGRPGTPACPASAARRRGAASGAAPRGRSARPRAMRPAVVQRLGLRHQAVQRGDRAERGRAQEGGRAERVSWPWQRDSVRAPTGAQPALWPRRRPQRGFSAVARSPTAVEHALDACCAFASFSAPRLVERVARRAERELLRHDDHLERAAQILAQQGHRAQPAQRPGRRRQQRRRLVGRGLLAAAAGRARPGCATASRTR